MTRPVSEGGIYYGWYTGGNWTLSTSSLLLSFLYTSPLLSLSLSLFSLPFFFINHCVGNAVSLLTDAGTKLQAYALAYQFTGDVRYANKLISFMTVWARMSPSPPLPSPPLPSSPAFFLKSIFSILFLDFIKSLILDIQSSTPL